MNQRESDTMNPTAVLFSMDEKKQEGFGSDGVDEFFGDDVEQEGAQPSTMAERCVLANI